jgi:hypothetical protein
VGCILRPWGLTAACLELGITLRETSLCLHAHTEDIRPADHLFVIGPPGRVCFELQGVKWGVNLPCSLS